MFLYAVFEVAFYKGPLSSRAGRHGGVFKQVRFPIWICPL